MTQRRKMAVANWKMNLTVEEGRQLIKALLSGMPQPLSCEVVVAPPYTHLGMVQQVAGGTVLQPGAQNCHMHDSGAYTGEVSVRMLAGFGVTYVITGHSERRQLFGETNEIIRQKVSAILKGGLRPIFCCGESLPVREAGAAEDFVLGQLRESLFHLEAEDLEQVVIAYEPIWAIGTGVTASPDQAQDMHRFIRSAVADRYGDDVAEGVRILYGGSVKADNALELFTRPDVDGGLVGGASLEAQGFLAIIRAACG